MELFSSVPSLILAILIVASSALAGAFAKRLALIFTLCAIALSVAIAPVMLFAACPLSELALVYSASFFAYLLPVYIKKKKGESRDI